MISEYQAIKISSNDNGIWITLIIFAIIILVALVLYFKCKIWDEPHRKIELLEISNLSKEKEIENLNNDIKKLLNLPKATTVLSNYKQDNISILLNILSNYSEDDINKLLQLSDLLESVDGIYFDKQTLLKSIKKLSWYKKDELNKILKLSELLETLHENNLNAHPPARYMEILCTYNKTELTTLLKHCDDLEKSENYIGSIEQEKRINQLINKNKKLQSQINSLNKKITSLQNGFNNFSILCESIEAEENIKKEILTKVISLLANNNYFDNAKLKCRVLFLESTQSNLTAIPYMSQIIADYETYGLENLASQLDWGYDYQRLKKVKSIREIRKDAKDMVEKNKEAQYQLAYLLELFPSLNEIIEADFNQLPPIKVEELTEYDKSKDYLTKEEYQALSVTERNQLALDRYKTSHNRSKWQIGRDYELYIGYQCSLKGYSVDYFGSYKGLEDLGRDLIVQKNDKTFIIQCKYWSNKKKIHEKHITQLYGTMMSYCVENDLAKSKVHGVLVTNITLSETAKQMANFLKIKHYENVKSGDYPCIKCNINNNGEKIYHLPFDQKYDVTKIDKKGEFFATTVVEAEEAGFRRALKWFG